MHIVNIKPLSVNQAWQGKRFKTPTYNNYIRDLLMILPKITVPDGELELYLQFGFSSASSDFDNPVKCFVDCLQKKYNFNDKMIKRCIIDVDKVKKGDEYIKFNLSKKKPSTSEG